jgi:hypothetical protein
MSAAINNLGFCPCGVLVGRAFLPAADFRVGSSSPFLTGARRPALRRPF